MSIQDTMPTETEKEDATDAMNEGETEEKPMAEEEDNDEGMKEGSEGDEKKDGDEGDDDEEEKEKKPKIDPKDWPLKGIKEPGDNDVLFGRGGGTNHAKGNKRYRKMVEDRKLEYVNSKRLDKPLVALEIIRIWRAQDPPGRFLKCNNDGLWCDVGDKKAREKTSQALREKAPLIRKQQEEEKMGDEKSDEEGEKGQSTKTTRFADGTDGEAKGKIKKAVLARDHSLGREYLQQGETMNLEGFSWRDPVDKARAGSQGSMPPPPPPGQFPLSQTISSSSFGMAPPPEYRIPSYGPPPPPVGGQFQRTPTDEYGRPSYSTAAPPIMPGYQGYGPPVRSGSWTHSPAHAMPNFREHSLSQHPLRNASAGHAAPLTVFDDGRNASGYWGDPSMRPPPPPGQYPYGGPYREGSGTYPPPHREGSGSYPPPHREGSGSYPPPHREGSGTYPPHRPPPPGDYHGRDYRPNGGPPPSSMMKPPPSVAAQPPYVVDPEIAKTWSGNSDDDISKIYHGAPPRDRQPPVQHSAFEGTFANGGQDQSDLAKPQIIKRMTSNQNETIETKPDLAGPSVKRAALNRDQSAAANRLKAASLPEYYNKDGKFDAANEIKTLTNNLEQSTLDGSLHAPEKNSMESGDRATSLDHVAMEMMARPGAITDDSRASTAEALALDELDNDPVINRSGGTGTALPRPSAMAANNRMSTMEACFADLEEVTARPIALTGTDRVSTTDYLDFGEAPLTEGDFDGISG